MQRPHRALIYTCKTITFLADYKRSLYLVKLHVLQGQRFYTYIIVDFSYLHEYHINI
jgi:hypothetical protein